MNEQRDMKEFADNLWRYLRPRVEALLAEGVFFYRAEVTANPGAGELTVCRPRDTSVTLPCVSAMQSAPVGSQVTVLVFGPGGSALVVGSGTLT